jgi:3D (Asp-Asp-Asp) domain-containing protein
VCEDTGGVIKGNKIDLYFDTTKECFQFGVKKAKIYVLTTP